MAKTRNRDLESEVEDEDERIVLKYLKKQNRPYNQNDIFNNLGGKMKKASITRALTQLAKDGLIREKCYGKQYIYAATQAPESSLTKGEIEEHNKKIVDMRSETLELQRKLKDLQAELISISNTMTQSDLNQKLSDIRKENSDLGEKIKALEISSSMMTTKKEQDDADAQLELMKSHWRKRKAIFRGIWDIICESMEGSPKDLLAKLGIEDDKDAGVDISTFCSFVP